MGGPLYFKYTDGKQVQIDVTDNFSTKHPFFYNRRHWLAVEQAYQASKIPSHEPEYLQICNSDNYAFWITTGGHYKNFDTVHWEKIKVWIMREIVRKKIYDNREIREVLKNLHGKGKFQASPDDFWSVQNVEIWNYNLENLISDSD